MTNPQIMAKFRRMKHLNGWDQGRCVLHPKTGKTIYDFSRSTLNITKPQKGEIRVGQTLTSEDGFFNGWKIVTIEYIQEITRKLIEKEISNLEKSQ